MYSEVLCGATQNCVLGIDRGHLQILQKMDSRVSSVLRWHLIPKSLGFPRRWFVRYGQEGCQDYSLESKEKESFWVATQSVV